MFTLTLIMIASRALEEAGLCIDAIMIASRTLKEVSVITQGRGNPAMKVITLDRRNTAESVITPDRCITAFSVITLCMRQSCGECYHTREATIL